MPDLTPEQLEQLADKTLPGGSRPAYFRALDGERVEVTEGFEQFSVLLDPSVREDIEDRLSESAVVDEDFNEIFQRAASFDADDAASRRKDYTSALGDFDGFRSRLIAQPFSGSEEVAALQTDVRRAQGRLVSESDQLRHTETVAGFLVDIQAQEDNPDRQRQIDSWPSVFGTYE
jgi:hypothetical protein